jgi:hypothetical protein
MQRNDLTNERTRALKNKLQPLLGYLNRLNKRIVRRGFPADDPLLVAVPRAECATHDLAHSGTLSCVRRINGRHL